jgi:hypothetical protein
MIMLYQSPPLFEFKSGIPIVLYRDMLQYVPEKENSLVPPNPRQLNQSDLWGCEEETKKVIQQILPACLLKLNQMLFFPPLLSAIVDNIIHISIPHKSSYVSNFAS